MLLSRALRSSCEADELVLECLDPSPVCCTPRPIPPDQGFRESSADQDDAQSHGLQNADRTLSFRTIKRPTLSITMMTTIPWVCGAFLQVPVLAHRISGRAFNLHQTLRVPATLNQRFCRPSLPPVTNPAQHTSREQPNQTLVPRLCPSKPLTRPSMPPFLHKA